MPTIEIARARGVHVVQQPRTGIADVRNHGVAHTTGDFVAFLDSDDRWRPQKLERQLAVMEDTTVGYCVTKLQRVTAGCDIDVHPVFAGLARSGPTLGLTPSTVLVRRTTFSTTGPFDSAHGHGCDTAWFARAMDLDIRRHELEEVLVEKFLHDRNTSIDTTGTRRELLRIARVSVRNKLGRDAGEGT